MGSLYHLLHWVLRSNEITVPSLQDFDPGAHLCHGMSILQGKTGISSVHYQHWQHIWKSRGTRCLPQVQRLSPTVMKTVCHKSQGAVDRGRAECSQVHRSQFQNQCGYNGSSSQTAYVCIPGYPPTPE